MAKCTHDCSTCSSDCGTRSKQSFIKPLGKGSHVKRAVAVASGKGGVGKSLTASLLAVRAATRGYKTALLDADITGPSVPTLFGIHGLATGEDGAIRPLNSKRGIKIMSMNCLLEGEEDPVVWRGSLIAGACIQFWTDVVWGDIDIMFIDMPPGTGDVPLSVFQSIPLSGIVIVTTPQGLAETIVGKAVNMAKLMNVPILGLVENMSYLICPDCGKKIELFGASKADLLGKKYGVPAVAELPLDPSLTALADGGKIEQADTDPLAEIFLQIEKSREIKDYLK